MAPKRVLLAAPRGFCAGVVRAIDVVDLALECVEPPLYVRKEIVHNLHVVTGFEKRGVRFVDELDGGSRRRYRNLLRARHRAARAGGGGRAEAEGHRRDVPARHQGSPRSDPLRAPEVPHHPDRPPRARGSRGHDGGGGVADRARLVRCGSGGGRGRRPEPGRVHHADDAVDGGHAPDRRGVEAPFPADRGAREGGHLLRDPEPPDRRARARATGAGHPRDRLEELLQLEPPRGGGGDRRALAPTSWTTRRESIRRGSTAWRLSA